MVGALILDLLFFMALVQIPLYLVFVRALDVHEKEPLWLIGFAFLWGLLVATTLAGWANALGDAILSKILSPDAFQAWSAALTAPFTEEILKGGALILILAVSSLFAWRTGKHEFGGPLDGLVFGVAIGLGFSLMEDLWYGLVVVPQNIINYVVENGVTTIPANALPEILGAGLSVFLMRRILGGLAHAAFTGFFGLGLGVAVWSRNWLIKIISPLVGLGAGMFFHFLMNSPMNQALMAFVRNKTGSEIMSWLAFEAVNIFATLLLIFLAAIFIFVERSAIKRELWHEAQSGPAGVVTPEEARSIASYFGRKITYWGAIFSGNLRHWLAAKELHNLQMDLALAKRRATSFGGEEFAPLPLRQEIADLRRKILVARPEVTGGEGSAQVAR